MTFCSLAAAAAVYNSRTSQQTTRPLITIIATHRTARLLLHIWHIADNFSRLCTHNSLVTFELFIPQSAPTFSLAGKAINVNANGNTNL
jgi:hypothetical protein